MAKNQNEAVPAPVVKPRRSRPAKSADVLARESRTKRLAALRGRDRLLPSLAVYDRLLDQLKSDGVDDPARAGLGHLTSIFRGTYQTVLGQIQASGKTGISAQNAVKRSAGTNFQGLCEYAVLRWLETTDLPVSIGPNAPKSMKDELTIFGKDADAGEFSVEPDIDISLWIQNGDPKAPIIFLSAKTSLVDRAGQAARWKLYLDLHQTACQYISGVHDCPIHRTKIKIKTAHPIIHSIVTANIYKIDTTQKHGELLSGQCRNNTYMFKHKFTTRNDADEIRPPAWKGFSEFPALVEEVFGQYLKSLAATPSEPLRVIPLAPIAP